MADTRIFKAREIDSYKTGWVADLSGPHMVNPDAYHFFKTRRAAEQFVALIDSGLNVYQAHVEIERRTLLAGSLGQIGGASKSEAKRAASASNGKKGGRPRKQASQ